MPLQPTKNVNDVGGGYMRQPFTLQMLYDWHMCDWNTWSCSTSGFNLVRYKGCTLTFYQNDGFSYIGHWETDFWKTNVYEWPFYHPAVLLNKKRHFVVMSKDLKPFGKPLKIRLKPPSLDTNRWYFMAAMANEPILLLQASLIDFVDSIFDPHDAKGPIQLTFDASSQTGKPTPPSYYWWLWDTGLANGYWIGDSQPGSYEVALGKGVPYWQSLFGKWGQSNVWIWYPLGSWETPGAGRIWAKLSTASLNKLIQSGPFIQKTSDQGFSIMMKYKFRFQFGGPDITAGIEAGQPPKSIPPGYNASDKQRGIQALDLASEAMGVAMPWDYRRGLLTDRGLQRLTQEIPFTELLRRSAPEEIAHLQSEEEETSSAEEEEEEEE